MIISEKQIIQLIQIAHIYLNAIDTLAAIDKTLLTDCGHHNKKHIASILMTIAEQQSEELKDVK
jgi:hypothetical protein